MYCNEKCYKIITIAHNNNVNRTAKNAWKL